MIGIAVIFAVVTALFVRLFVRERSLVRNGVEVDAVCESNRWRDGVVASVCSFALEGGERIEVASSYRKSPLHEPGQPVRVRYEPGNPHKATLVSDEGRQGILILLCAVIFGALTLTFSIAAVIQ
ncbi:DUF3592 domain-containing protein [Streptomyces syringium]|uniref:DUF3592 domain-containing protein n=1 Tax=Streptomyces syringium TaxID=76729 RepID=UPI00364E42D6